MAYRKDEDLEFIRYMSNKDLNLLVDTVIKENGEYRKNLCFGNKKKFETYYPHHEKYIDELLEEIQTFGGNTIANIVRLGKGVSYKEIVLDICNHIGVEYDEKDSVELNEQKILIKLLSNKNKEEIKSYLKDTKKLADSAGQKAKRFGISAASATLFFHIPVVSVKIASDPAYRITIKAILIIALLRIKSKSLLLSSNKNYNLAKQENSNDLTTQNGDLNYSLVESKDEIEYIKNNSDKFDIHVFSDTGTKIVTNTAQTTSLLSQGELFTCTVPMKDLVEIKGKFGKGYGTAVMGDKGIKGHAAFQTKDLSKVITPFMIYQIASIALGQHFMFEINNKLKDMENKLYKLIDEKRKEHRAELETEMELMCDIYTKVWKSEDDVRKLDDGIKRAKIIQKIYFQKIQEIQKKCLDVDGGFFTFKSTNIQSIDKQLQDLEILTIFELYNFSVNVEYFANFMKLQYYIEIDDKQEIEYMKEYMQNLHEKINKSKQEANKCYVDVIKKAVTALLESQKAEIKTFDDLASGLNYSQKQINEIIADIFDCEKINFKTSMISNYPLLNKSSKDILIKYFPQEILEQTHREEINIEYLPAIKQVQTYIIDKGNEKYLLVEKQ